MLKTRVFLVKPRFWLNIFIATIFVWLNAPTAHSQENTTLTRASKALLAQEQQKTFQQLKLIQNSLLNAYWDMRTFPSSLQGLLSNVDIHADWNGPYLDSLWLRDPWGQPLCYLSLSNAAVPNPYNRDGSAASIPRVQVWSNGPGNQCSAGVAPASSALITVAQPDISKFGRETQNRLNIAVRTFNQSGLLLSELTSASPEIDAIPKLSEYHKEDGANKFLWHPSDYFFYSRGLDRQDDNGYDDDIVPTVTMGDGPCQTMITADISANTTWVLSNSPYCIGATISITGNFDIEPGVEVLFLGNYNVTISKPKNIQGTSAQPIRFSSFVTQPGPSKYEGGYVNLTGTDTLSWLIVEHMRGFVHSANGAITFNDSIFRNNIADGSGDHSNGGAIRVVGNGALHLNRSTFQNNSANGNGGAIYRKGNGNVHINDSTTITFNNASNGGGVYVQGNGNLHLKGCSSILNNSAGQGGGVWYADISSFFNEDVNIANNTSDNTYTPDTGSDLSTIECGSGFPTVVLTVLNGGNGTVTSDLPGIDCGVSCEAPFTLGTTVTLTATPAENYSFGGWSQACVGTAPCAILMDIAKTVTASFVEVPQAVTLNTTVNGSGTLTSTPAGIDCGGTCSASFTIGTTVTLTALTTEGHTFSGWSGDCSGTGVCEVAMDAARNVTATFAEDPQVFVLTTSTVGSGGITSTPSGIDCGSTCSASYTLGTTLTLNAVPNTGHSFSGWSGNCSGTGSCPLTMDADKNAVATFEPIQNSLNVSIIGSGTVTSTPSGIDCGSTCSAEYEYGTTVTLTAIPGSGQSFSGWSGACSGFGPCQVVLNATRDVTATFAQITHTLTVSKTGSGNITSSPSGIDCGSSCSLSFNHGQGVTLTAEAEVGFTFSGWSGDCSGTGACQVTLNAPRNVSATFTQITHSLTVSKTGSGTITSNPSGINCGSTCNNSYNYGTVVTLTANPDAGYSFSGWSGGCSGTGTCGVTLDANRNVSATFTPITYPLTTSVTGSGSIGSTPSGIDCGSLCNAIYNQGAEITLSAVAGDNFSFDGWTGACSGSGACAVTMDASRNVQATFTEIIVGINGTVTDPGGQPIALATVEVFADNQKYSTSTASDGKYAMNVPVSFLPDFFAMTASKTEYVTGSKTLAKPDGTLITVDFVLEPIANKVIVEVEKDLHHLGDDTWSPASINSQFQRSSEGLELVMSFQITDYHRSFNAATMTFNAKGAGGQGAMSIQTRYRFNNQPTTDLEDSNADGSFKDYSVSLTPSSLLHGTNTLTMYSGRFGTYGSWDDFEFVNIVIEFTGPGNGGGSSNQLSGTETRIEAESATVTGNFVSKTDNSASGDQYMVVTEGTGSDTNADGLYANHRLSIPLHATISDKYYLWLRVYGTDKKSDSFFVQMDEGSLISRGTGRNKWRWKKVSGSFTFSANSDHTLTLYLREDGARIDKVLLTPQKSYSPQGTEG